MSGVELTAAAFEAYRRANPEERPMHPDARRYPNDTDQLKPSDGLLAWQDGPGGRGKPAAVPPDVSSALDGKHLWALTATNVFYAKERCPFGATVDDGKIKHSNLTGGGPAFAAGEVVLVAPHVIVLSGQSGRYRISAAELADVSTAFKASGYDVWSMGYGLELGRPYMFHEKDPEWVP
jgi:hypothetical protein